MRPETTELHVAIQKAIGHLYVVYLQLEHVLTRRIKHAIDRT